MEQSKIWTVVLCLITHIFWYMMAEGSENLQFQLNLSNQTHMH